MFEIVRLEVDRQLNVGNALAPILAADRPTPLLQSTRARAEAVIGATLALSAARHAPPAPIDHATDSVTTALDRTLEAAEQTLRDSVVPLGAAQRSAHGQIRMLRTRLFPGGTGFIRKAMDKEWPHLAELRAELGDAEVAAAVDALGLRPIVDHLLAHIELYGRALGQEGGAAGHAVELASAAWQEAFKRFAAQVILDYEGDQATQRELLGPFQVQLEQQRAAARAAARARKARAEAEEPAPPSGTA